MGWTFRPLFLSLACSALALGAYPVKVEVDLKAALVPVGFDTNDNTQIVVTGNFPDSCHKIGPTEVVQIDKVTKVVTLKQTAYHYNKGICLKVRVPYSQVVNLGMLPEEGDYKIKDNNSKAELGTLPVAEAKVASPDDFLYAPIDDAYLKDGGTTPVLTLRGQFTNRCMSLKGEPEVKYYKDVVVVLPVAQWKKDEKNDCTETVTRFTKEVTLQPLTGTRLIHVRSMNGQSINQVFDFSTKDRP